jgi:hypothetical protein
MVYVIDSHDRLTAFDPAFRAFAAANGAPGLPDEWLGRTIWKAGASTEINMVIGSLVCRARRGQAVSVRTRCDSPLLERFVQMELAAGPDGAVTFTSTAIRARLKQPGPGQVLRMCPGCFRVGDDSHCCGQTALQLEEADSSTLPSPFVSTSSPS